MLADKNNRFLFEVRPDLFPEGHLTRTEMELWSKYLEYKQQIME